MSLQESHNHAFRLKIDPTLLSQLCLVGVEPDAFVELVAAQFQQAVNCKPNYHLKPVDKGIWIIRGFYPGTPVFFKLTIVKNITDHEYLKQWSYFVRAKSLRVHCGGQWWKKLRTHYGEIVLESNEVFENITNGMENQFFNAKHDIQKLIATKPPMPRCMAPKGMKLLRFKKPSKRKARAT